jgi:dipeptidyl-peptidase-4
LAALVIAPSPDFLRAFAETRAFLLGRPSRIQPAPDGATVLFLRSPPRDPTLGLYELTVATGETRELVTPAQILGGAAEQVSDAEKARRERMRVTERGFTSFLLSPDGGTVLLPLSGHLYLYERGSGGVRRLPLPDGAALDPRFSPDGKRVAFVLANDLWVVDTDTDLGARSARPLTEGGSDERTRGLAEFVAQEEMARHEGYWWSPVGDLLAYAEVDQSGVERFAIADPARPERAPVTFHYPRPGRANARVRLGLVGVDGDRRSWVTWDDARYPYLARVLWDTPHAPLTLLVQTRDQREVALLAVDPRSGATRPLLVERDEAWVNLERDLPRWLPDGSGFLWASEASGLRTLALHRPDGARDRELLSEGFLSVVQVGATSLVVLTGGQVGNRVERLSLRDGARAALTDDDGEHAPVAARDGSLLVDTRTGPAALPEAVVLRADGATVGRLPDAAETPPFRVNLELTTAGEARFPAAIVRPRDFQAGRRYPVIVQVYGGPHALTVKADERQYLLSQWIADHGAVVVCLDNRGTPRRDRGWERAIKGRFGEVPLEDQVAGLRALGARYPELDLERVGVFGWSFGGYMAALAVLRRPEVFKVGVAGAPVVDWLDYDTHYTERYLDLPDAAPEAYRSSSLLTHAAGLERPLMIIHGTADDNVYFFHALKLADALFRAGRPFELVPLAGVTHQVPDPEVRARMWRRIVDYLFSHV